MDINTGYSPSVTALIFLTSEIINNFGASFRGVAKTTVQRCFKLREILRQQYNVNIDKRYENVLRNALETAEEISVRWKGGKQGGRMKKTLMGSLRVYREKDDVGKLKSVNETLNDTFLNSMPAMFEDMRKLNSRLYKEWDPRRVISKDWEIDPRKPLIKSLGEAPYSQGTLGFLNPVTRGSVKLGRKQVAIDKADFEEYARILFMLKECENVITFEGGYWDDVSNCGNLLIKIVESQKTLENAVSNGELQNKLIWQAVILSHIANALSFFVSFNPHVVVQSLNPRSILLDKDQKDEVCPFTAKICDFSTADTAQESRSIYARTADTRSLYVAPEKRSNSKITTKVDVWSFGWIVYFIATGNHPPSTIPYGEEPLNHLNLSSLDPMFVHVIHKCLRLNPGERAPCDFLKKAMDTIKKRFLNGSNGAPSIIDNPEMKKSLTEGCEGDAPVSGDWGGRNVSNNHNRLLSDMEVRSQSSHFTQESSPRRSSRSSEAIPSTSNRFDFSMKDDMKSTLTPASELIKDRGQDDLEAGKEFMEGSNGRPKDESKAQEHFYKAVQAGNPVAMNILGKIIMNNSMTEEMYREAFLLFQRSAHLNYPGGMVSLGYCYEMAKGARRSDVCASRLYEKAAQEGHPGGMCNYARCLEIGFGVKKNLPESAQWYSFAASLGNHRAMCGYGFLLEELKCYREAFFWYKKAADANYPLGLHLLGLCYEQGRCGLEKDIVCAKVWYQKAADLNYRHALRRIGSMHERGEAGLLVNYVEAIAFYEKAMKFGDTSSAICLKRCRQKMNRREGSLRGKIWSFLKAGS